MLKIMIGAVCVATFGLMFWITGDLMNSGEYFGPRFALALDFGVTLAVGYGLFVLADRFDLAHTPPDHRGLLQADDDRK